MIDVYLPIDQAVHDHIDRGSGIVGSVWDNPSGGRIVIDYEGGRYHQSNIKTFADRVYHAAGRHSERYPTAARMSVEADSLVKVGTFDARYRRLSLEPNQIDNVAAWIGCTVADLPTQLTVTA